MYKQTYSDLCVGKDRYRERRDCTVMTAAVLCDLPYGEAHDLLRQAGRRNRCGFSMAKTLDAIESIGFHIDPMPVVPFIYALRENGGKTKNRRTLLISDFKEYPDVFRTIPRRVYASTMNHSLPILNGEVQDWSTNSKGRIRFLYMVNPKSDPYQRIKCMKWLEDLKDVYGIPGTPR